MNLNISDFRNPQKIRRLGFEALAKELGPEGMTCFMRQLESGQVNYTAECIEALVKELGPVGMTYFMRQFEPGQGDYTAECAELLKDVTMDDILRDLEKMRAGDGN
ncbi:MAG: hypothetical protein LBS44_01570 [Deltaproteobacteria bacterium]|jgi:hypothetical protein|nr:hypothetical protein [Deltaproteobacteria bacterium]